MIAYLFVPHRDDDILSSVGRNLKYYATFLRTTHLYYTSYLCIVEKLVTYCSIYFLFICPMLLHAQTSKTISSKEWKEDIHFVVETIEKEHPDPYWRVSKDEFQVRLNQLLSELDQLNDLEIQVRLIQLVAYLQDGHTDILPYGPIGFKSIFPIRFYQFTDGIFITAISIKYKEIAGSQVLKVGDISINNVIESTATLWNNENEFRKLEGAVFYLSCPEALKALNIIENLNTLPLTIRLKSGEIKEVEISRDIGEKCGDLDQLNM